MAISPVSELNQILAAGNANSQKSAAKTDSEFQNLMEQASRGTAVNHNNSNNSGIQGYDKKNNEAVNTEKPQDSLKKTDKQDAKTEAADSEKNNVSAMQDKEGKDIDEAAEKIEEAVIEETAEKLGISEEDLLAVMEQLGLTAMDLLKPENVSVLVASVLGDGDITGLVTDETMLSVVKDINTAAAEIAETVSADLGMDKQDFLAALDQINKENKEPAAFQQTTAEETGVTDAIEDASSEETVFKSPAADNTSNENDTAEDNSSFLQKDNEEAAGRQSFENRNTEPVFTAPAVHSGSAPIVTEAEAPMPALTDPREILEQMSAQIRSRVTPEITQLQMQLNPENLGTVGLTVSMKEGQMTAQFTTQNEEVRAAIEAQITVLKENLEQQGVKIEAVEVMVGSHAFERNLEQGNESNEQQEKEQEKLRKATRKIDLGEYGVSGGEDEFAEDEQVTVDMMQADGNRMDYKV